MLAGPRAAFWQRSPPPFPVQRLARIPLNKLSRLKPSAWYSYGERLLYAARVTRILGARPPDLIYTRDSVCAYRFVRNGLPVLYEVHDLEATHPGQTKSARLTRWLEKLDDATLRGARGIVSLTETFRREILARSWQSATRVFVIPDAYDDTVYFPRAKMTARDVLGLPRDAHIIAYAGMTFKYRGLDVLLRAFRTCAAENVRLILVGGRDFEIRELQHLARELAIEARVEFVGRRNADETANYLAAADVLVIPDTVTDATASPLKMFEYMAMARPIVCVERESLREILDDAAIYFPRGDVRALSNALQRTLQPDAQPLAERARERVAAFTYRRRAEKIVRAAETVLNA